MILNLTIFVVAVWTCYACFKWTIANRQKNKRKDDQRMRDELSRRRKHHGE